MSGGLLEPREDGGSPPADSQSPGVDGKRNWANNIGCEELRKEPSQRTIG